MFFSSKSQLSINKGGGIFFPRGGGIFSHISPDRENRAVISRDSRWALLIEGLRLIAGGEPGWAASRRGEGVLITHSALLLGMACGEMQGDHCPRRAPRSCLRSVRLDSPHASLGCLIAASRRDFINCLYGCTTARAARGKKKIEGQPADPPHPPPTQKGGGSQT